MLTNTENTLVVIWLSGKTCRGRERIIEGMGLIEPNVCDLKSEVGKLVPEVSLPLIA